MTETFSATAALLAQANAGDQAAWNALVVQHSPILWSVARAHRLDQADAADVVQTTWLRLVEHLGRIEDPDRLIGWLVDLPDESAEPLDAQLLADERNAALWAAFRQLPERCQRLLRIAVAIPKSYGEVSAALDMPVGSIGPTRARCLSRLRDLLDPAALGDPGLQPGTPDSQNGEGRG
jgi:DNA-directed RNA polymerase specialized sigma24 family protein